MGEAIGEDLALQKGIVHSTNANLLLRDNATVTGASDSSHVQGPVTKVGNDAFVFPVGKNGAYRPIAISAPSSGSAEFRGEYFTGNSGVLHNHGNREAPLGYIGQNEYWALDRLATSNTVSVTLGWDSLTSCAFDTLANLRVTAWSTSGAGQWKNLGNGGTTGNLGVGAVVTGSASNVFDLYALATIDTMYCCNIPVAIAASGSLSHCVGDSSGIVTLTGSGNYSDFVWTADGDVVGTGSPFAISDFRTYVLSRSACAETDTFVADVPDELHLVVTPQLSPEGFSLSCYHATDGMVNVILAGGEPPYSMEYTLDGQPFPPSFAQLGAGVYMLAVTDQTGCTVSRTAELFGPDESFALGYAGPDRTITAGSAIQIGSPPMEGYSYQWTPEIGLSNPTVVNPVAYPSDTTVYVLTVWTADSCVSHDTMIVNVLPWEPTVLDSAAVVWIDSMPSHVRGELIVKFKPEMLKMDNVDNVGIQSGALSLFLTDSMIELMRLACYGEEMSLTMNSSYYSEESFSPPPSEMDTWGIRKIFRRLTSNNQYSTTRLGEQIHIPDFWATFVVTFPIEQDELIFSDSLNTIAPQVRYAEPNGIAQLTSLPNDPLWEDQLSLDSIGSSLSDINILPAWDIQTGQSFVKVGVYDSGIEWEHEDFQVDGSGTYEGSKVDGYDYYNHATIEATTVHDAVNPNNGVYHGSACAGIIGALRNNSLGVAGIAGGDMSINNPGVSLFAMKISDNLSGGVSFITTEFIADAIIEGATRDPQNEYGYGLHIMSHSWVQTALIQILRESIFYAYTNGVVTVASRGNISFFSPDSTQLVYPACLDSAWVLNVAASGLSGELSPYTKYGEGVDVLAPGLGELVQTVNGNANFDEYMSFSGTSASVPHVAGVVALMLSQYNQPAPDPTNLAPEDVEYIIKRYAKDKGVSGWDYQTGAGLLDAGECLYKIKSPIYTIWHSEQNPTDTVCTLLSPDSVVLSLPYEINGIPSGIYWAYKYQVTNTYEYSASSPMHIIDGWARYSSTNGYAEPDPLSANLPDLFMENFQFNLSSNTATTSLSTYAYFVGRQWGGGLPAQQINRWIPSQPSSIKLPYSLYIVDSTSVGLIRPESTESDLLLYPNPAMDMVIIEFKLASAQTVTIKLMDVLGQIVSQVSSGIRTIGEHRVQFSVADLSQSIYLVQVEFSEGMQTKKLILNR